MPRKGRRALTRASSCGPFTQDAARQRAEQAEAADIVHAFSQAAQYIALSYALQPGRDIYQRSLKACTAWSPWERLLMLLPHAAPVQRDRHVVLLATLRLPVYGRPVLGCPG